MAGGLGFGLDYPIIGVLVAIGNKFGNRLLTYPSLKAWRFFLRRDSDEFTCKKASQAVCPTAASPLIKTTWAAATSLSVV